MNKKIIMGGIGALCLAIGIGAVIIKTKEKKEVEENHIFKKNMFKMKYQN
ncbi:hypothetical protein CJD_A0215 [Clostridium perfringens D str. JGS1721]|uniref:Uncharacterized protein n=1 Tax=Clostridium perfringens D str. JGS1721 TaxID=488537 RepID=B1V7B7_CLOPF|nr:hypothetical protein [Clostridium perfringens]EDT70290.1 hypothetical protein CJD_A0215 [Clostridium perfringens D str. JGS1721]